MTDVHSLIFKFLKISFTISSVAFGFEKNAAKMVKDTEMKEKFWNTLSEICENEDLRTEMAQNLEFFSKPKATEEIVNEIFKNLNIKE